MTSAFGGQRSIQLSYGCGSARGIGASCAGAAVAIASAAAPAKARAMIDQPSICPSGNVHTKAKDCGVAGGQVKRRVDSVRALLAKKAQALTAG